MDLTSWTDSLLSSLNSIDLAVPSAAEPATAVAAGAEPAAPTSYDLPIITHELTEPTVQASFDGGSSVPVLVDTGSSGLVIDWQDLGSGSEFQDLLSLGFPTSFGESGYSGGVDYLYATYNLPVDYADGLDTTTPVEVEVYSWDPSDLSSFFSNDAFQGFLNDNEVSGILGIGDNTSGGAGESPFEAAGFGGVTVDEPANELIVEHYPGYDWHPADSHRLDRQWPNRNRLNWLKWFRNGPRLWHGLGRPRLRWCLRHHPVVHFVHHRAAERLDHGFRGRHAAVHVPGGD